MRQSNSTGPRTKEQFRNLLERFHLLRYRFHSWSMTDGIELVAVKDKPAYLIDLRQTFIYKVNGSADT